MVDASNTVFFENYSFARSDQARLILPVTCDRGDNADFLFQLEEVGWHIPHIKIEPAHTRLIDDVKDSDVFHKNRRHDCFEWHVEQVLKSLLNLVSVSNSSILRVSIKLVIDLEHFEGDAV